MLSKKVPVSSNETFVQPKIIEKAAFLLHMFQNILRILKPSLATSYKAAHRRSIQLSMMNIDDLIDRLWA